MEVILYIIAFLAVVVLLGLITAWAYGIPLGKEPEEMGDKAMALYFALKYFLAPAEFVVRLFRKKKDHDQV